KDSFVVPVRAYLETVYPNGVKARGPNSFNVNLRLSKTFGFREVQGNGGPPASANAEEAGGEADPNAPPGGNSRAGIRGGPPGGGGRLGGGGGGGRLGGGGGGGRLGRGRGERDPSYRYNLTFSMSANNLFNRVNYGNYIGTLTSPFFGRANSARGARRIEFQL